MARATLLFPLWALALSALAFFVPALFTPFAGAIVPLLALIMFAMGTTLTPADFARILRRPQPVAFGVALQFGIMPLAAFLLSQLLQLPPALMAGMVLVGASSGGTASNVICYLARGDVALSITLTLTSTLLAVLAMPALTWLYVGRAVPVPVLDMLFSVLQIVLAPVVLGTALNALLGARLQALKPVFPLLSMAAIVFIIAVIVALNQPRIADLGLAVLAAVVLHNGVGLAAGYALAAGAGYAPRLRRTLAIEVGMQNSGLAVAMATQYFSAAAALPGALFSIWHNLSGAALAGWWAQRCRAAQADRR